MSNGLCKVNRTIATTSRRFTPQTALVLVCVAIMWLLVIARFWPEWSANPEYSYGWAVPLLCAWLVWERVKGQKWKMGECSFSKAALGLLVLLALLYLPTRLILEANPIWRLPLWLIGLELAGFTLGLVYFWRGWRWVKELAFPVGFFLIAIPWPTAIRMLVVDSLTRLNIAVSVEALGWLNIPALQRGNIIDIGTGLVGVEEACSGLRSFQASLMIALFFGELYRLNLRRRLGLMVAGVTLAFFFNIVRTILLVAIAARKGVDAISKWHDPIGIPILVGCFLGAWLLALWLAKRQQGAKGEAISSMANDLGQEVTFSPGALSVLSASLLLWMLLAEATTEGWFRVHERSLPPGSEWSVTTPTAVRGLTEVPIPLATQEILRFDSAKSMRWIDAANRQWRLFYFRWLPTHAQMDIQTALLHRPESCLPAIGFKLVSELEPEVVQLPGVSLAFRTYIFDLGQQRVHVFHCVADDRQRQMRRASGWRTRLTAAWQGQRHAGFRVLEIGIAGCQSVEEARRVVRETVAAVVRGEAQSAKR